MSHACLDPKHCPRLTKWNAKQGTPFGSVSWRVIPKWISWSQPRLTIFYKYIMIALWRSKFIFHSNTNTLLPWSTLLVEHWSMCGKAPHRYTNFTILRATFFSHQINLSLLSHECYTLFSIWFLKSTKQFFRSTTF